jgi:hypothetical protein
VPSAGRDGCPSRPRFVKKIHLAKRHLDCGGKRSATPLLSGLAVFGSQSPVITNSIN